MGRPRKRQREELGDKEHSDSNIMASGGRAAGGTVLGFQDLDLTAVSGTEPRPGADTLYYPDNDLNRRDIPPSQAGSRLGLSNTGASSLDFPGDPLSDLEHGFPNWDLSHDLGQTFSTFADVPLQLQTPPSAAEELDSNNNIAENAGTDCSCLSDLYSMLAKFQKLPAPSFPFSMGALRSAAALSRCVVACDHCSLAISTALQNAMLLGTLLQLLIMEYAKLLNHIDERSKQAEKIVYRLGDPSTLFDSRHTGLPDCPMGINVDFSGEEWRALARKAVAQEVLGNSQGFRGLVGLVQEMKDRQILWRERYSTELCKGFHNAGHQHTAEQPDHLCAQAVHLENLKRSLDALEL